MKNYLLQCSLFFPFFLFLLLPGHAQSPYGVLTGSIQSEGGQALAGIHVGLEGTSYGAATNQQGHFSIRNVPAGKYLLVVSGVGYEAKKQTILVQAGEKTVVSYQLNSQTSELTEVVITASHSQPFTALNKIEAPARDIPLTTSSVSLKTLEQRAVDNLGEAMKNTTGVRANTTYGGFQHFTIRGFSNFVLLVDGVRDERHNLSTSAPSTNLANVERIEVLKGPASVLFGHSALGGIINLVRKQPTSVLKANFSAAYGSFNTRRISVGAGGPISNTLRYRVDVGLSDSEGYRQSATQTNNAYVALEYTPSANDYFSLTVGANKDHYATDTGIPMLEGGVLAPGMNVHTRYNDPTDFLKHTRSDFQLRYVRQFHANLRLSNQLSYSDDNIDYLSTEQLTFNEAKDSLKRASPLYFNHLTKPLQNQLELTAHFTTGRLVQKLLVGYSLSVLDRKTYNGTIFGPAKFAQIAVSNPVLNQGNLDYVDTRYNATQETVHGLYVQDWMQFTEKLKGLVGLRYDGFSGTYFSNQVNAGRNVTSEGPKTSINKQALTYRAGCVFQPIQLWSVYGSFSTYFKPSRRVAALTFETFDPETGYQGEVGSRLELSSRMTASASVYYMRKNNQLESFANNVYKRIGSVESKGFEVEWVGSPLAGLDVTTGYTFTDAHYLAHSNGDTNPVAGNRAVLAPKHMMNAWVYYTLPQTALKGLSLGAGANSMSKTFANSANTFDLAAYTVVDASVGYRIGHLAVQLNVNNVLNEKYFTNVIITSQFYPGATRNYLLSLRYNM